MANAAIHPEHDAGGVAPRRVTVIYGFWLFIISDLILFSSLIATYAVLRSSTDGGPTEADLFDASHVAIETAILLVSSFTCGLASIATHARSRIWAQVFFTLTLLLGGAFLALELAEFQKMINGGAGPQRSAFLSSFFALVGCHGIHVFLGVLWGLYIQLSLWRRGFAESVQRKIMCFSLFWHALDIVWIGVFTIVYLVGLANGADAGAQALLER